MPPPSNGNMKYIVIGLLLVGATGALIAFTQMGGDEPEDTSHVANNDDPQPVEEPAPRPSNTGFEIPTDEELAEEVVEVQPEKTEPRRRPRPRGPRECNGTIDGRGASQVLAANNRAIQNCYERRLRQNNALTGRLSLTLQIGQSGQVINARVDGSMRDSEVRQCVRAIASRLRFPGASDGCATINQPYDFTPTN